MCRILIINKQLQLLINQLQIYAMWNCCSKSL